MYSSAYLSRFAFFRELMESTALPAMHDSLTGLIARPYMLRFIQALIAQRVPFAMAIVDLDNFKSINDNYGHRTGDEMLARIGADLSRCVGESGVAGRYGGDEFLIVYFDRTDYDGVHAFLSGMYQEGGIFRRDLPVLDRTIFSTATIGCAVYPKDADSFETLFALADKTLYRGKSKGRNCFILYVAEKHAHLEIPSLARRSLYDIFCRMAEGFDGGVGTQEKLCLAFRPVQENLRMHRLFFIDAENRLLDPCSGAFFCVEPPRSLLKSGLFTAHGLDELACCSPTLAGLLTGLGFESVLLCDVAKAGREYGCLVFCPEVRTLHIWQESECVTAFYLSRLLAEYLADAE